MCTGSNEDENRAYSIRQTAHLITASSTTSFTATHLIGNTFRLVEDDQHIKRPFIYVKVYPAVVVVIDTGCNAPNNPSLPVTSLREFIETVDVEANGGEPLNRDGKLPYLVVLSHCHYDHIGVFNLIGFS
jgi:glyoxylase-like metal-dependent hydrolase (beta-lactamase superfamily II)